ncbi:hypothetical protein PAXRUDRAFT_110591, partial [Paxillus rubicundulus Ve08.2h10]
PISPWPSHPGLPHTQWLPFLSPPINHHPLTMPYGLPHSLCALHLGPSHTPWLLFLGPPISPFSSPMGCPAPPKSHPLVALPWPTYLTHIFSVSPFIPSWCPTLGPLDTTRLQSIGPPITSHYISVLHILYCYTLSYLTLGQPIHYGQLHS